MKSITKRIISTLFICGALVLEAGATAFSSIGKGIASRVDAATPITVTYAQTSCDAASVSSGTAPTGSSVDFNNTYTTKDQLTKNNSMTFTLKGYAGHKITALSMSMHSNKSAGTGKFSLVAGSTTLAEIASNTGFNQGAWYGSWTQSYVTVTPTMSNTSYEIKNGEDVVLTISASANSLFCQSITLTYEKVGDTPTTGYTVTYDGNGNTGGSVPTDSTSYSSGASVTVKDNTGSLVKTGFTFDGWNTQADGKGTSYSVGSTFNITANTTLYANWKVSGGGSEEQIIIDAKTLNLNSDGVTSETSYGGYTFAPGGSSNKVKSYGGDNRKNNFSDNGAILIGKKGAYLYNTAGFAQKAVKFEMYWNIGGSTAGTLSLGIQFSDSPLTSYSTGTNTYTNSGALTQDSVYDLSSYLTSNCKYFYLKVNSDHNAQVQFRVTLEKAETKTVTNIAVKQAPSKTTYYEGETFDPTGLVITATYNDASTSDFSYAEHGSDFGFDPKLTDLLTTDNKTVTITYGGKTVDQAITVNENLDPYISSVEITKSGTSVLTHEDITASAKVTVENDPSSTLSKNINWVQSSEDGGEVTFSKSTSASEEQITISGKTAGTVTIQAKSAETPTVLDSFTLTVGKNIVVTDVSIDGGDINKTSGYINDTQDLTATVSYQYDVGTNAVTWESSQPDVVSVEASTGRIKFLANTTSAVTITATSVENTEKSDTISVTASNLEEKPQIGGLKNGHKYFILSSDNAILTAKAVNKTHTDYTGDYAFNQGKNKPFTSTATVTSGKVTAIDGVEASDLGEYAFTFTNVGDNQWKIGNGTNMIGNGDTNNGMSMNNSTGLVYTCSESSASGGTKAKDGFYTLKSDRYITYYSGGPDWRTYGNLDNGDPNIYFVEYVAPVKPDTLTLDTDEYTFTSISGTKVVIPTVLGPDSADVTSDYEIEWESTNEECATVAENTYGNGVITPVGAGTATITATIDGQYTESGNDLVESVEITVRTFGFDEDNIPSLIAVDETLDLNDYLLVDPDFDGSETYVWTSSDDTKLSVEDGVITGIAETEEPVTITVTVSDENNIAGNVYEYTDSIAIEVASGIVEPVRVELSANESNLILGGDSDEITAVVYGEDDVPATAQDISISGSYSEVVDVDEEENVITISPKAVGEATIIVNFVGGDETTAQEIAVKVDYAALTSIELSADTTEIFGDGEVVITATPNEHASLDGVEFTVTPAIATVTHKEGNVYTLTANDKYVGGTVSITASDGNVDSNELSIEIVDYLNPIMYTPIVPGEDIVATFTATSGSMGTTSGATFNDSQGNTWTVTRDAVLYTGFSSGCVQFGKSSNAEELTLTTTVSKPVKSVSIECSSNAGSSKVDISVGSATYLEATNTSSWTTVSALTGEAPDTGAVSGLVTIHFSKGTNAKYVRSITLTCEGEPHEGEPINISNTNSTMQKQVVEYAHWLNENYSDGIEASDWATISAKYSEVLGSLDGDDLDLAKYMFKHAEALTGTDSDCLQNCVSLYDAAAKKYNLVDSSNNFMGRTLEATTYAYSYDVGEGTATGGSDAGNYVYGSEITLPSVSYEGYKFDGWYTDSGFTTPLVNTDGKFNMPAGAVTAYAKWVELDTYNVELSEDSEFIKGLIDAEGNPVESIKEGQDLELIVDILDSATTLPDDIVVEIDGEVLSADKYFYGDVDTITMIKINAEDITGDVSITIVATHGDIEVDAALNGLTVDTTFPQTVEYGTIISGTLTPEENRKLPSSISVDGVDASLVTYNSETGEFSFPANAVYEITISAYADYINAPINQDGLNENDLYVDETSIPTGVDAEIEIKTNSDILDLSTIEVIVTGVEDYTYNSETHVITIEGQYVVGPIEISGFALPKTVNVDHSSIDTNVISYTDMTEGETPIPAYLTGDFLATILPQEGYENVELTITMNGVTLIAGEGYTYDSTTGLLFIENITGDIVINATASLIPEVYTITIQEDADITVTADKETVTAGDSVTFTVELSSHYHVDSITYTVGGGEAKTATLDENKQFTIENVAGNIVVTAKSKIDSYSVTYNTDTNSSATGAETVAHGNSLEVTVTVITDHYHIDAVTYTVNGGESQTATLDAEGKFTITGVDGPVVVNVTSAIDTFTVEASGDDNVDVTFNATSPVDYETDVTFTVTADEGYNIATVEYKMGDGDWESAALNVNNQFTLHVTGDVQVRATSAIKTFDIILPEYDNFVINAVPNPVDYNGSTNVALSVDEHYHVTLLGYTIGDGTFVDITDDVVLENNCYQFQINGITGHVEVALEVAIDTYTVTTSPDTNSFINVNSSVDHGDNLVVEVGANETYHLVSISYTIEGEAEAHTVDIEDLVEGKFTIDGVTGNVSITVTSAKDTVSVTTTLNESTAEYDITNVNYGASYHNSFTANDGYYIVSITYQIGDADPVTVNATSIEIGSVTAPLSIVVNTEKNVVCNISVNVNEISISVGNDVDLSALTVTATYKDGSSKAVSGFTVTGYNKNVPGEYNAVVSYTEGDITVKCNIKVVVSGKVITSIEATGYTDSVDQGKEYKFDGKVIAHYSDNSSEEVTGYIVEKVNTEGHGPQTVKVTYEGVSTTITINVIQTKTPLEPYAIVAIAGGSVVGVAIIAAAIFFLLKKFKL